MYKVLFLKMAGGIFIAVAATHYLLYLKTGRMPDLSVPDFSLPDIRLPAVTLPFPSEDKAGSSAPLSDKPVYTWRDERGVLHFSENPPETGQADIFHSDRPVNLMNAVQVPASEANAPARHPQYSERESGSAIDRAIEARELLERRQAEQQRVLDRL